MDKIYLGYFLDPLVWLESPYDLKQNDVGVSIENIVNGIDLGILRQGLVIVSINKSIIPNFKDSIYSNILCSDVIIFILDFLNCLSFSFYEAHLKYCNGGFSSIPQELKLEDIFLWQLANKLEVSYTIEDISKISAIKMFTGIEIKEYAVLSNVYNPQLIIKKEDIIFRSHEDISIYSQYVNLKMLDIKLWKIFSFMNRGIIAIRNALFDNSLVYFWTVIETIQKEIWIDLVIEKEVSNNRRKFLFGKDYTAAIISENLALHGIIKIDLLDKINETRKARNEFMHRLSSVSPKVLNRAYSAIEELVKIKYKITLYHRDFYFTGDIK